MIKDYSATFVIFALLLAGTFAAENKIYHEHPKVSRNLNSVDGPPAVAIPLLNGQEKRYVWKPKRRSPPPPRRM